MFIRVRVMMQEEVHVFHKENVKVYDVIERMTRLYNLKNIVRLYNEHGREMKNYEVVENARVYTLLRGRKC